MAEVLNFLTERAVQHNCKYRTVAIYKLVISQARSHGVQPPIGQLPVVSHFMKGIFRLSPPRPRLDYTWDVKLLLEYFSTLEPLGS